LQTCLKLISSAVLKWIFLLSFWGVPSRAYVNEMRKLIDAEIFVPEYSDVRNGVGALAGNGTKRIGIIVRMLYSGSKYDLKKQKVFLYVPLTEGGIS
jgi:hypothetical protein